MHFSKNIQSHFYCSSSIEFLFYLCDYKLSDSQENIKYTASGDGGVYLTQGFQTNFKVERLNLDAEVKLQNRSFLIAKEVRLMTPNAFELIPNSRFISPGQGLFLSLNYNPFHSFFVKTKSIFEYSNQQSWLTDNQVELLLDMKKLGSFTLSMSARRLISDLNYFWYPVNRSQLELSYSRPKQNLQIGINGQQYNTNEVYVGLRLVVKV